MKRFTTLVLTAIAGYIDTVTFVSAGTLFAAHVTGNFVLFGAALVHGVQEQDYVKLVAFPIFVLFASIGALIFGISSQRKWRMGETKLVLLFQALLFLAVAGVSFYLPQVSPFWLALVLVAAMGLQNSLHRYVPGPMTTVMTGTVMNWAAARTEMLFGLPAPEGKPGGQKGFTGWMMVSFALGCGLGAVAASYLGLGASLAPGLVLLGLVAVESILA